MSSRGIEDDSQSFMTEEPTFHPVHHARNDSHGLGITDESDEKAFLPPPEPFSEKPWLGTDRFGQLRVETGEPKDPVRPWYRRFFWWFAAIGAALLALLIVLLVMYLPQKHSDMPVQEQWQNLTGFPAMPTGIATVIQPKKVRDVNSCVDPSALWSCSVPPREQSGDAAGVPDFRFEIRFRNHTEAAINSTELQPATSRRAAGLVTRATAILKRSSSAWTNYLYTPSPAPPSTSDQIFLGSTTDNNSEPYNGEETPFFISLLSTSDLQPAQPASLSKRDNGKTFHYPYPTSDSHSSSSSTTAKNNNQDGNDAPTQAPTSIPRPILQSNGHPAPATLYPFASAQPLRLYNRGQPSEHYGFYTYFDRSLYVSNITSSASPSQQTGGDNNSSSSQPITTALQANVPLASASAVCTWSQTRLLVQIWTRKPFVTTLSSTIAASSLPAGNSSANDFHFPGSFPYAVSVTLDRHGGVADEKGVYCYGLDGEGNVVTETKTWVYEDRGAGGTLVHPAEVPGNKTQVLRRSDGEEGIDGGSGGCSCSWENTDNSS